MIAYLDTSVLLRLVLREPGALEELRSCDALVSSELVAVESLRTIDRLRVHGALSVEDAASRREATTEWLEAVDLVLLQRPILARASGPSPQRSARWTRTTSRLRSFGAIGCGSLS